MLGRSVRVGEVVDEEPRLEQTVLENLILRGLADLSGIGAWTNDDA